MISEESLVSAVRGIFKNGHGNVRSISFLRRLDPNSDTNSNGEKPILEIVVLPPNTEHILRDMEKPFLSAGDPELRVEPLSEFEIYLKYLNPGKDLPHLDGYQRHQMYSSGFFEKLSIFFNV